MPRSPPYLDAAVDSYMHELIPDRDPIVAQMEEIAARDGFPIIGPQVGSLLRILARSRGAKRIFEMGSGYGYSAAWTAPVLPAGGELHWTDGSVDNEQVARAWLEQLGVRDKVRFHVGRAQDALVETPGEFDMIFNDVDKEQYPEVFALAFPRLRPGGLLVTDNTLWSGSVVDEADQRESVLGVREYNRLAFSTPGAISVIMPVRDGVTITVKDPAHPR